LRVVWPDCGRQGELRVDRYQSEIDLLYAHNG